MVVQTAQEIRMSNVFAKNLSSVPKIHMQSLTTTCDSSPRKFETLLWIPQASSCNMHMPTRINRNKSLKINHCQVQQNQGSNIIITKKLNDTCNKYIIHYSLVYFKQQETKLQLFKSLRNKTALEVTTR